MSVELQRSIKRFRLFTPADRILVAASGGKDSTALLYLLSSRYKVTACYVDPGIPSYSDANKRNIARFCRDNAIPLKVVSYKERFGASLPTLHRRLSKKGITMTECALCGVLKRRLLQEQARKAKATVIATGHTLDDISQSVLMNIFRAQPWMLANLAPKQTSDSFITRVKPLFFVKEAETRAQCKALGLRIVYTRCPYAKHSFRAKVRSWLGSYELQHPGAMRNLAKRALKQKHATGKAQRCSICHEPSSKSLCRVCELVGQSAKP